MSEWSDGTKSRYLYWIFSVGPMIAFLIKIDILGLEVIVTLLLSYVMTKF